MLFPSPRDLPDPVIEPTSFTVADGFFTTEAPGKPAIIITHLLIPVPLKTEVNLEAVVPTNEHVRATQGSFGQ